MDDNNNANKTFKSKRFFASMIVLTSFPLTILLLFVIRALVIGDNIYEALDDGQGGNYISLFQFLFWLDLFFLLTYLIKGGKFNEIFKNTF